MIESKDAYPVPSEEDVKTRLINQFHASEHDATSVAHQAAALTSDLRAALASWWHTGSVAIVPEVCGFDLYELMRRTQISNVVSGLTYMAYLRTLGTLDAMESIDEPVYWRPHWRSR